MLGDFINDMASIMLKDSRQPFVNYFNFQALPGRIYEAVLRHYVGSHETEIERKRAEWRLRLWELAIFNWQNCTDPGQSAFFTVLDYLAGEPARITSSQKKKPEVQKTSQKKDHDGSGTPPEPLTVASDFRRHMDRQQGNRHSNKNRKWFSSAPPAPTPTIHRIISETPNSQVRLSSKSGYVYVEEDKLMEEDPPFREVNTTDISSENQHNRSFNPMLGMFRRSK